MCSPPFKGRCGVWNSQGSYPGCLTHNFLSKVARKCLNNSYSESRTEEISTTTVIKNKKNKKLFCFVLSSGDTRFGRNNGFSSSSHVFSLNYAKVFSSVSQLGHSDLMNSKILDWDFISHQMRPQSFVKSKRDYFSSVRYRLKAL